MLYQLSYTPSGTVDFRLSPNSAVPNFFGTGQFPIPHASPEDDPPEIRVGMIIKR